MEDTKFNYEHVEEIFHLHHGFSTRCIHAGEHVDRAVGGFRTSTHSGPIHQSSTFVFRDAQHGADLFSGRRSGFIYTRLGNPTVLVTEAKLNALEASGYKIAHHDARVSCQLFSSGMAAVSHTFLAALERGDTVIVGSCLYGCTQELIDNVLPKYGVKAVSVDTSNLREVERVLAQNPGAKMIFFETPTNPTLRLTDIAAVSEMAKAVNPSMLVAVDNTFMTSYLQRPIELGADVVVYSTTKYICGHGTVVGGAVVTTAEAFHERLYTMAKDIGGIPSPFDAWLVNQGLKTLPLRMEKHCQNAMQIARYLSEHPKVAHVWYPGLESFPDHALARRQMAGFGGVVSFDLRGGYEAGVKLMDGVKLFTLAVSLGCVDSLIEHPASMTHAGVPAETRLRAGITDGLVRVSVGIEDADDLMADLEQALLKVGSASATAHPTPVAS